jgi:hypothetical protein
VLGGPLAFPGEFASDWPREVERVWIGPAYWANRLQDWRVRDGRLECVEASAERPMRTVHLLTRALGEDPGTLNMSVTVGAIEAATKPVPEAWVGFLIGAGGAHVDYRLSALVHHRPAEEGGLFVGIDGSARIVFRDNAIGSGHGLREPLLPDELPILRATTQPGTETWGRPPTALELTLYAEPAGEHYVLRLVVFDREHGRSIGEATLDNVDPGKLSGSLALVSHGSPAGGQQGWWFRDWRIRGSKVTAHEERAYGPVLAALHTLSGGVLKMTAQMGPLGEQDTQTARLEVRDTRGAWQTVGRSKLIDHSYTFPFRVEGWDGTQDVPYRVVYDLKIGPDEARTYYYEGTIPKEPKDRNELVIAALGDHRIHVGTPLCWNSSAIWFPHNELLAAIKHHKPDVLFFAGDQVYEGDLTWPVWRPLDKALLDYLEKWYRWCWAFGELARDVPCICNPDDHDIYQGNFWGDGGHATDDCGKGGYYMPAEFVNMVERTQTSHLPDPYDPTPIDQGIDVHYTAMNYAGVSFAILEDRKWKSPPIILPKEAAERDGWINNPNFDARAHAEDVGARLLGERQLKFLRNWAADWHDGVWMKVVLSHTVLANLATIPEQDENDAVAVGLPLRPSGEIVPGQKLGCDTDSNGWPAPGRDKALREFRRAFALHICGDQHLASVVHHGIDGWEDASYAFCLPPIGNIWPRRWYPPTPGENHQPGDPPYTGRYRDGFGNRVTVHAVANPFISGHKPADLHDRATGYGIVRLNRKTREITIECWPRWADPAQPDAQQYLGWPITIQQLDNYARQPAAHLPLIEVTGMADPVIQVIDEATGDIVYTLRIAGRTFRPPVFGVGTYTLKVGEPGTARLKTLTGLRPAGMHGETVKIPF